MTTSATTVEHLEGEVTRLEEELIAAREKLAEAEEAEVAAASLPSLAYPEKSCTVKTVVISDANCDRDMLQGKLNDTRKIASELASVLRGDHNCTEARRHVLKKYDECSAKD